MKNNVCDDILITAISMELARHGLIVPISELECVCIRVYDEIKEANSLVNGLQDIHASNKDDRYYGVLCNIVCADFIARRRLEKAQNIYDVTAMLSLLQGYLDNLSDIADTEKQVAPRVFEETLKKLPFEFAIKGSDDGWQVTAPRDKGGKVNGVQRPAAKENIPIQDFPKITVDKKYVASLFAKAFNNVFGNKAVTNPSKRGGIATDNHICSTCGGCMSGACDGCNACGSVDCDSNITVTVEYGDACFGYRLDPALFGLTLDDLTQKRANEGIGALKHAMQKAIQELSKLAPEIYDTFRSEALTTKEDTED